MTENPPAILRGMNKDPWYEVAVVSSEAQAAIIAGLLESAGIPTWVYYESAGRAIGLGMGLLGTVRVLTPEDRYEEAMDLLEADDVPELEEGDDDDTIIID